MPRRGRELPLCLRLRRQPCRTESSLPRSALLKHPRPIPAAAGVTEFAFKSFFPNSDFFFFSIGCPRCDDDGTRPFPSSQNLSQSPPPFLQANSVDHVIGYTLLGAGLFMFVYYTFWVLVLVRWLVEGVVLTWQGNL